MKRKIIFLTAFLLAVFLVGNLGVKKVKAQTTSPSKRLITEVPMSEDEELAEEPDNATASSTVYEKEALPTPRPDLTQETVETVEPLKALLDSQKLSGGWLFNPLKHAIRNAVNVGVPPNTIVLLLMLPGVAALIAAARHLVGIRGFGIFLPAALAVTFVATGPVVGILLFLAIVFVSTGVRLILRKTKLKLQYLPRMALLLHFVVLGILAILFLAPLIKYPGITNVSIFPVLILVLLAEEFSRVQLGKSAKVAVSLTTETLILALFSFGLLTLEGVQKFALLHPETWIISIGVVDYMLGKYVGLRLVEYFTFKDLISK